MKFSSFQELGNYYSHHPECLIPGPDFSEPTFFSSLGDFQYALHSLFQKRELAHPWLVEHLSQQSFALQKALSHPDKLQELATQIAKTSIQEFDYVFSTGFQFRKKISQKENFPELDRFFGNSQCFQKIKSDFLDTFSQSLTQIVFGCFGASATSKSLSFSELMVDLISKVDKALSKLGPSFEHVVMSFCLESLTPEKRSSFASLFPTDSPVPILNLKREIANLHYFSQYQPDQFTSAIISFFEQFGYCFQSLSRFKKQLEAHFPDEKSRKELLFSLAKGNHLKLLDKGNIASAIELHRRKGRRIAVKIEDGKMLITDIFTDHDAYMQKLRILNGKK